jgi:predicted nucleic acid-binding protein
MNKSLVDTNILVYAKDKNSKFHVASLKYLNSASELFITSKNLSEYYSVMTKGTNPALTTTDALVDLQEWRDFFTVLYPSEESIKMLIQLIRDHNPKGLLIHDYEIVSIGLASGISTIITFNEKDFPKTRVDVIVPN